MKNILLLSIILFLSGSLNLVFTQSLEMEKTCPIKKGPMSGYLLSSGYNDSIRQFYFTYVTKLKNASNKVQIETYNINQDFNLVSVDTTEIDVDQGKNRFRWWLYKGDNYEDVGIDVLNKEELTLVRKEIKYKFNWAFGKYKAKVRIADKEKLKGDSGQKYINFKYYVDDDEGLAYVLCGLADNKDKKSAYRNMHLLTINKDFEIIRDVMVRFDKPQTNVIIKLVMDSFGMPDGFAAIFVEGGGSGTGSGPGGPPVPPGFKTPPGFPGGSGGGAGGGPSTRYTFVRINKQMEITDTLRFESPSSYWEVDDIVFNHQDHAVFVFGAACGNIKESYSDKHPKADKYKFKTFQLAKIGDHKIQYLTETPIADFEAKLRQAPSQKKGDPYYGKKFIFSNCTVTKNGDLLISGQNFATNSTKALSKFSGGSSIIGSAIDDAIDNATLYWIRYFKSSFFRLNEFEDARGEKDIDAKNKQDYKDCFVLHFNQEGQLQNQFSADIRGTLGSNQTYPRVQFFLPGKNPAEVYWLILAPEVNAQMIYGLPSELPGFYESSMAKLNLTNNALSDFVNYQASKTYPKGAFQLFLKNPYVLDNNSLYLLGADARSNFNTLWFARIGLE